MIVARIVARDFVSCRRPVAGDAVATGKEVGAAAGTGLDDVVATVVTEVSAGIGACGAACGAACGVACEGTCPDWSIRQHQFRYSPLNYFPHYYLIKLCLPQYLRYFPVLASVYRHLPPIFPSAVKSSGFDSHFFNLSC